MAANDAEFRTLAQELIAAEGASAVLHSKGTQTYNPATMETTIVGESSNNVTISPPDQVTQGMMGRDSTLETTDMYAYLAAKQADSDADISPLPAAGMRLVFDSKNFEIIKTDPLYSGDQIAAYLLFLRV